MLALNRPSQPRLSDLPRPIAQRPHFPKSKGQVGQAGLCGRLSDCVINQPGKGVHERFSFTRLFSRISNFRAQATIAQRKLLPLAIRRS
jgi:hypothetical protein